MPDSDNGLSESQMAALESKLRERQAHLREELRGERADSESERDRRSAREVQDRGDEANTGQWREANAAVIDHHEVEIQGIQAALSRLASGTYGMCVSTAASPLASVGCRPGLWRTAAWPANRKPRAADRSGHEHEGNGERLEVVQHRFVLERLAVLCQHQQAACSERQRLLQKRAIAGDFHEAQIEVMDGRARLVGERLGLSG